MVGGGGWVCYLVPLAHLRLWRPAVSVCSVWGGLLLIPGPPHSPQTLFSLYVLVGSNGFDQSPFAHPQLRRGPCSARKSQLTPQIPTRLSSVGSPATDSGSPRNDFCCGRNTTKIQIEGKDLSINSFIVQRKERYLIPRVIVISITIPPLARISTASAEAEEEENILGGPFTPPPPPSLILTLMRSEVISLVI